MAKTSRSSDAQPSEPILSKELLDILDLFASRLDMVVSEFNARINQLKTGMRDVRGNDAVPLGRMKVHGD